MTFPGVNRQLEPKGIQKRGCSEAPLQTFGQKTGELHRGGVDSAGAAMRRFPASEQQRAQRFAIHTVLRYRKVGEAEWRQGTVVNISESGVLFETDHAAWPKTAVEMRFSLGLGLSGRLAAQVVCYGLIVRSVTEAASVRVTALAARITKFHFVRPGRAVVA
jgi:PilZ domain